MSAADEARAVLLTFAQRLRRARSLSRLDGPPTAVVAPHGDGWRAEAHLTGCRVVGAVGVSGVEDGAAGAYGHAATPGAAVAAAIGAWRAAVRQRRDEAERVAEDARETADGWRRLCAEVGA